MASSTFDRTAGALLGVCVLFASMAVLASTSSDPGGVTPVLSAKGVRLPATHTILSWFGVCLALLLPVILSSPFWLPPYVVKVRMYLFTKINGDSGMQFPNADVGPEAWKELYSKPDARLRSRQKTVGLSDIFFYFLMPGADIHQEHVETGTELHRMVNLGTKMMLNVSTDRLNELASRVMRQRLSTTAKGGRPGIGLPTWRVVSLRDFFFPMFARFWYELLFDEECTDEECALIAAAGSNVINALKCTEMRDMPLRNRLTDLVASKLAQGKLSHVVKEATAGMTPTERALHVQGVFFHTGDVQMSEAMTHAALALAAHPEAVARITNDADGTYLDSFITESLRTWPLFGIAHRIASADIKIKGRNGKPFHIPKDTVMCFNYPEFHAAGFADPADFKPDRWATLSKRTANYAPFGVKQNRPCPAQRVALIVMKAMTKVMVEKATWSTSVRHDRSLPSKGPCLVVPQGVPGPALPAAVLQWMKVADVMNGFSRSLAQLVYGTRMMLDARNKHLAKSYQAGDTPGGRGPRPDYHFAPASVPEPVVAPASPSVASGAVTP